MKLSSFDSVHVPMPDKAVDDARVHDRANEIVAQIPCYADVTDQAVGREDRARVRIAMREDGEPVKGLDGTEITVSLGDGFFPKGLVEGMEGMMPGERRRVSWSAARMGAADADDRSASFDADVEVVSVRKRVRPEMTDAWVARHIPRCSTLEEFFSDIRGQLEREESGKWDALLRQRCAQALALRLDGKPSLDDVTRSIDGVRENFDRSAAREGKTHADKLAELGMTEEELQIALAQEGMQVVLEGAAVRLMADHLGMTAGEADVERVFGDSLRSDPGIRDLAATEEGRAKLAEAARCEMALDYVVEHAVIEREAQPAGDAARTAEPERPSPFAGASVA